MYGIKRDGKLASGLHLYMKAVRIVIYSFQENLVHDLYNVVHPVAIIISS